jgi:2-keto-4-pentenoate hydratase/2-oxohepta-3-ene-1,7-dioic acid hydratase in catechol pathway
VLVSADEIKDPQSLRLVTRVNGEIMQNSTSKDMVWSVAKLISFLSQVCHAIITTFDSQDP